MPVRTLAAFAALLVAALWSACGGQPAATPTSPPTDTPAPHYLNFVSSWNAALQVTVTQYAGESPPCQYRTEPWQVPIDWQAMTTVDAGGEATLTHVIDSGVGQLTHWLIVASEPGGDDVWCRVYGAGTAGFQSLGWRIGIAPGGSGALG